MILIDSNSEMIQFNAATIDRLLREQKYEQIKDLRFSGGTAVIEGRYVKTGLQGGSVNGAVDYETIRIRIYSNNLIIAVMEEQNRGAHKRIFEFERPVRKKNLSCLKSRKKVERLDKDKDSHLTLSLKALTEEYSVRDLAYKIRDQLGLPQYEEALSYQI